MRSALSGASGLERALPISVAALVLVASVVSVMPAAGSAPDELADPGVLAGWDDPTGAGPTPRVEVLGVTADPAQEAGYDPTEDAADATPPVDFEEQQASALGLDGSLGKPLAPETTVVDGRNLLTKYTVRSGDTLSGIARRSRISTMTLIWANNLKTKDLHVGQVLIVPPVSGLVIKVKDTDTLDSIAKEYEVSADEIVTTNRLTDRSVTMNQILVIPGGQGAPMAVPATPRPGSTRSGSSAPSRTRTYSGGRMRWPVAGGYISRGYFYGHWALDIAADMRTPVYAAAGGTVIFAGWKNNGGGWQVWISHGSGVYTTYNHMSSYAVRAGQQVARGTRVGRIGMTGNATGPHLHFEVWTGGKPWAGGTRRNPLNYL